jgi:homoserine dehydrogenase
MLHTGDTFHRIMGCFSGTLGFLCTRLQDGVALEAAVEEAVSLGYTEPDPREDLSGRDVGRKALIVARAMGLNLEPEDIQVEAFVPGLEEGLAPALHRFAKPFAEQLAAARARDEVIRYVADIRPEGVRVGVCSVPADGPIGSLRGPDNMLVFTTDRYLDYPLVIRGPGAGAAVTAAGVLGDMLKIARVL